MGPTESTLEEWSDPMTPRAHCDTLRNQRFSRNGTQRTITSSWCAVAADSQLETAREVGAEPAGVMESCTESSEVLRHRSVAGEEEGKNWSLEDLCPRCRAMATNDLRRRPPSTPTPATCSKSAVVEEG
mmetsp:Transcript_85559/g.275320  ORF Transcript_85559/g.275320 Transcript_85559/m.275320 type:complete len:129 (-) Transcript_85559:372-758(-)